MVVSLWKVDDTATALLMCRFYQNLLGHYETSRGPYPAGYAMPKAEALGEAKGWLRHLTLDQVRKLTGRLDGGEVRGRVRERPSADEFSPQYRPYASPYYWAAFILIGDPA